MSCTPSMPPLITSCWLGTQWQQQESLMVVMESPWLYGAWLGNTFQHFLLKRVLEVSLLVVTNAPPVPISVSIGLHCLGLPEASIQFYMVFVSNPQKQHLNKQYIWWRGNHDSYSMQNPREFDLALLCVLAVSLLTWVHHVLLFLLRSFSPVFSSVAQYLQIKPYCKLFTKKKTKKHKKTKKRKKN